jgi:hypothetical protein
VAATDETTLRLYGRILVLLALANELRARNAPAWRLQRNRLEVDRAIADLARGGGSRAAETRDGPVTDAFRSPP